MKNIMFNDKFCLTQAVLEGRKTMTRRMITAPKTWHGLDVYAFSVNKDNLGNVMDISLVGDDGGSIEDENGSLGMILPKYKIGEEVAVSQSYKNAGYASDTIQEGRAVRKSVHSEDWDDSMIGKLGEWYIDQLAGWNNKMFTYPEMMPHHIRITDIRCERLQEISDEDCLNEGISRCCEYYECSRGGYIYDTTLWEPEVCPCFGTPQEAFASLIDKVSGKGTWERNPLVFVYEFEKVD